uniref:centromere protein J isoform X3 n=1 Tax=Doryrhamphus excisus TaxID=161450 RepID=UPI0025AE805A|nr:centromere protein J isoform X3 [Doryrhamphus excisus]
MSSPVSGLPYSQMDFLSRWMPSSTRAGVILNPGPELAEAPRYRSPSSAPGSPPLRPDEGDSCASDFAPLPASANSSCLGGHDPSRAPGGDGPGGGGHRAGPTGASHGEAHSLAEMSNDPRDAPILMKLEELRRWQQHMQEQLKADQLGELLRLQEEQQRLLGMMNTSHLCTEESLGAEPETSSPSQNQCSPSAKCGVNPQQEDTLTGLQSGVEMQDKKDGTGADAPKKQVDGASSRQCDHTAFSCNNSREDESVLDDRPITAGKQTFEQLLEEQLRLEEQRLKSGRQHQKPNARRAFLRRGQGLSRFANNRKLSFHTEDTTTDSKATPQARNSGPTFSQGGGTTASQRLPVQRKTATLNKENRPRGATAPPQHLRVERKAAQVKVLGCHQRQNTARSAVALIALPGKHVQHRQLAVTKEGPALADGRGVAGVVQDSLEGSLVEKLQRWECERQLESMELGEFELLEQAAEELSFSSTSSFVTKVLQMDQQNQKLLGVAGLHQRRLSSTPIKCPPTREQRSSHGGPCGGGGGHGAVQNKVRFDDGEDSTSTADVDIKEPEASVSPPVSPGDLPSCFPVPPEPAYDRRSYQDEDAVCQRSEDGESDVISSIDSTLTEDKDAPPGQVVFDDEDTWSDLDDMAVSVSDTVSTEAANREPEAPPSKLMVTLFPSLKPKTLNAPRPPCPPQDEKPDQEAGQCVHSTQLREKVAQLEMEMERFQKDNAALAKLRREYEKKQENLRRESEAFEKRRAEQLTRFEDYKKEESRKLQRERKLFEKHAVAMRATPDKKEREEIQVLKEQLSVLQEELRRKESRWSCTHTRLRQQMDSLRRDNLALRDQVRTLEMLRISALKRNSPGAEGDMKCGPPGTKGVTFASPPSCSTSAATRGSSKDSGHPAHVPKAMKSSLRKPGDSGPSSSSSSSSSSRSWQAPGRKKVSQEQSMVEDSRSCSPVGGVTPGADVMEPQAALTPAVLLRQPGEVTASQPSQRLQEEDAQEVIAYPDGKVNKDPRLLRDHVEKVLAGGDRVVIFPNGTRKELSSDGVAVKVTFFNGDTKEVTADHRVIYYYADARTTHVTHPDGVEVLHFPNNQTEKHFPDGRKEITFADQTVKNVFPDGSEESVLADGTVVHVKPDGTKEIHFNTGQREVHTADYKRRAYPDGTVKTVYADGRQETRYPTGRLRVKDKDGNVVADSRP